MTAHVSAVRQPFAPLDNPRLQHLASAKNRQNGIIAQQSTLSGKPNASAAKDMFSPSKRSFATSTFDEFDGENVDPAVFNSPSKKSKCNILDVPVKPFTFSLAPAKSMPPPSTVPSHLSTPIRASNATPRAPMTAPAGRSPKRKMAGIGKARRISAPFGRIDPPFSSRSAGAGSLPFSLDAALSGTLSSAKGKTNAGATIQESMPSSWIFDIHEDTPEEEAANLMEHSTLTLDLSSDEEESKSERLDVGKENMPPEGYDAPTASRAVVAASEAVAAVVQKVKKSELVRKKLLPTDDMDDGQRSPLSDLETEPFFSAGLDKDAHVIVDGVQETAAEPAKSAVQEVVAKPVPFTTGHRRLSECKKSPLSAMFSESTASSQHEEIQIWEDKAGTDETDPVVEDDAPSGKVVVADENVAPTNEERL